MRTIYSFLDISMALCMRQQGTLMQTSPLLKQTCARDADLHVSTVEIRRELSLFNHINIYCVTCVPVQVETHGKF